LTIVARDGTDVVPEEVEFVAVTISMRVDVIVNCTNDPSFDYFIYAGFASGYLHSGNRLPAMAAQALLTYSNITRPISATDRAHLLDYKRQPDKQLDEYRLYKPSRSPTTPGADHRIFIHYAGVNIPGDGTDTGFWTVNENRFMMPMRAPLLQSAVLSSDMASAGLGPPMQPEYSSFTESTYIEHLEHGKRYEIVLWSRNGMFHPWHLHGHTVDVIRVGKLTTSDIPSYLNEFNQSRKDWRNFDFVSHIGGLQPMSEEANVLFRGDSFTVPDWGYVIFRFTADNIGPWMFHCHIEWFAIGGSIW
jgi:FtsP/CotA-like multicopper oxidase with cupredoxin domain